MTERLLNSTLGVKTLPCSAPPYGIDHQPETADEVAELPIAQSMGYLIVGARIDPHDWGEPGGIPPAPAPVIVQRVLEQARSNGGNIVLLHDGGGDRTEIPCRPCRKSLTVCAPRDFNSSRSRNLWGKRAHS